jgi:uncharacterized membrane protein
MDLTRKRFATILVIVGAGLLIAAAWTVSVTVGLAVAGVLAVAVGLFGVDV